MRPPPYKPGSRVQDVWEKYKAEGAESAFNHGISLSLAAGTLRSWIAAWAKGIGGDVPANGKTLPKADDPKPIKMYTKDLVTVSYVKTKGENKAYLIAQGPQQSVVKFVHNGREDCIENQFLGLPVVRGDRTDGIYRG